MRVFNKQKDAIVYFRDNYGGNVKEVTRISKGQGKCVLRNGTMICYRLRDSDESCAKQNLFMLALFIGAIVAGYVIKG